MDIAQLKNALYTRLREEVQDVAQNHVLSKNEQAELSTDFVRSLANDIRIDGGPGTRVYVRDLVDRIDIELGYFEEGAENIDDFVERLKEESDLSSLVKLIQNVTDTSAPQYELGVISDIDKTIKPPTGGPYPGIVTLLNILTQKNLNAADVDEPIAFVTARDAARIVEIPDYFETHGVPQGPIEHGVGTLPWVAEPEKIKDASIYFDAYPDRRFILFGDSSHRDPEVYQALIEKYGDRVIAAFIHKVNRSVRPDRVDGLYLIEDYAEVADILHREQVLDDAERDQVILEVRG